MLLQKECRRQYLTALAVLERKQQAVSNGGGDPSAVAEQEEILRRARQNFEMATSLIADDFQRYKADRTRELIAIMKITAQIQIDYTRNAASLWSGLIPALTEEREYGSSSFVAYHRTSSSAALRTQSNVSSVHSSSHVQGLGAARYVDATDTSMLSPSELQDDDIMIGV